jgi:D-aminopeptidase
LRGRAPASPPRGPFAIEIDVAAAQLAVAAVRIPGVDQLSLRTVRASAATMVEAYLTFRLATVMIGGAMLPDWS